MQGRSCKGIVENSSSGHCAIAIFRAIITSMILRANLSQMINQTYSGPKNQLPYDSLQCPNVGITTLALRICMASIG